jgi:hypothetical protein
MWIMASGPRSPDEPPGATTRATLGGLLREARVKARRSTRELGYSSGHISNVEGGRVTPSRDLVEIYIELGADRSAVMPLFESLQHQARSRREQQQRLHRANRGSARPVVQVGADMTPDAVRRYYRIVRYDAEFVFDATGAIRTVTATVALRATMPGARFYYTGHQPAARRRRPDLGVTALYGATIAHTDVTDLGDADVFFELDREISPDDKDAHVLSYQVHLDDDDFADPEIHYVTRPGVEQHRLTARFTAPAEPRRLWLVTAPDAMARVDPAAILAPSGPGRYEYLFDPIVPGWTYGFAWTWPSELIAPPAPAADQADEAS